MSHRPDVYEVNTTKDLDHWIGNYSVIFLSAYDQEITEAWHVSIHTHPYDDVIVPPTYLLAECVCIGSCTEENQSEIFIHN